MTNLPQKFYYKKNRLQQLKGFYYTIKCGSISKAAIEMGLNQSTVTLQLQSLERDLKVSLLERHSKPIQLTKDGKLLYEMAAHHLQGIDNLYEEFLAQRNGEKHINIATDFDVIAYRFPEIIAKFNQQHPKVTLAIKNLALPEATRALENSQVDVIVYPNIVLSKDFSIKNYRTFDPVLIMSPKHSLAKDKKISIEEINSYNIIKPDSWLFDSEFRKLHLKSHIQMENINSEIVKLCVQKNLGLGLVSSLAMQENDCGLLSKKLNQYFPVIDYKIAYKTADKTVHELINLINS